VAAETELERMLSVRIMRAGQRPEVTNHPAGTDARAASLLAVTPSRGARASAAALDRAALGERALGHRREAARA
jgi:hypothetical protein